MEAVPPRAPGTNREKAKGEGGARSSRTVSCSRSQLFDCSTARVYSGPLPSCLPEVCSGAVAEHEQRWRRGRRRAPGALPGRRAGAGGSLKGSRAVRRRPASVVVVVAVAVADQALSVRRLVLWGRRGVLILLPVAGLEQRWRRGRSSSLAGGRLEWWGCSLLLNPSSMGSRYLRPRNRRRGAATDECARTRVQRRGHARCRHCRATSLPTSNQATSRHCRCADDAGPRHL